MSEVNLGTDLFGDTVVLPSGRRGRPAHRWSQENHDRVVIGLALDYSDQEISFSLGISLPTLRKYYFSALKRRAMEKTRFELWQAHTLATLANAGNVAALKELRRIEAKRANVLAARRMADADAPVQSNSERLGKKKQAQQDAELIAEGSSEFWGDDLKPGYPN